jgi:predicted RNase H-like nuclease
MYVVGVDGCRAGWLAVKLTPQGQWEAAVFPAFAELWDRHRQAALILVDIPIGLKEGGPEERRCDKEARAKLWPHGNSVFPAPRRPTIYYEEESPNYRKVTNYQKKLCGKGLSLQTHAIVPKIRQVDALLLKEKKARKNVREVHPEICFWAFNGGKTLTNRKKLAEGFRERVELLKWFYPLAENLINAALAKFKRKDVARDDILDALAAAVTALLGQGNFNTIPEQRETDAHGLPMEIVYVDMEGTGAAKGGGTTSS